MPTTAPKPARKPSRTSLITERLMADFAHCQRFSLPCRFSVGRYTGYSAGVVGALQRRGYVVVKVRGSQYEIKKLGGYAKSMSGTIRASEIRQGQSR